MAFFIHSGKGDARKEENASYIKQRREKMNGIMVLVAYAVLMIVATIVFAKRDKDSDSFYVGNRNMGNSQLCDEHCCYMDLGSGVIHIC